MLKNLKRWYTRLGITNKMIFNCSIMGFIALLMCLTGIARTLNIISDGPVMSYIAIAFLIFELIAAVYFCLRYYRKKVFSYIIALLIAVICCLAVMAAILKILPYRELTIYSAYVVLALGFFAAAFLFIRFFKNNIVSYIWGLTIGIDTLAEGNLSYFDNDLVCDEKSKDETVKQAMAFVNLVVATREKVQDTKQIAQGDLTTQIHIRSEKDVLGNALHEMMNNIRKIVDTIVSAANEVASGSNMVAESSAALSKGASEQADTVQELTASLNEIAEKTKLNAQNAEKANELVNNAKINATDGNTQMKEMLNAMNEINASSANINKVIKVIDDLAFQTNILALNAAVEAARAGQHGKGFAVVAEEVRTLAAKSANAAKETTEMIESSISKAETGSRIANATADSLNQIVTQVEKAADLVNSIAIASNEQAEGIEHINQGIKKVSQVVTTNAATSEESAAASQELSSQAINMMEAAKAFKLKRGSKAAKTESLNTPDSIEPEVKLLAGKYS